jgi:DNA-binding NarL/FixJ family response regulator
VKSKQRKVQGAVRERGDFRLALVDARSLVRNALSYFLQTWVPAKARAGSFLVLPFSSTAELLNQCPDVDVVALNIGAASLGDERVQAEVRQLRARLSHLPLVLMSDLVEPKSALEEFRHGIKGYIPTTLNPSVTIEALRLVCAGGTFVPSDLVLNDIDAPHHHLGLGDVETIPPTDLTRREHEVLDLIRQGRPNKMIAAELSISESTVKVYVRQIMKKLGAINRTHACYLLPPPIPDDVATRFAAGGNALAPPGAIETYRERNANSEIRGRVSQPGLDVEIEKLARPDDR